MDQQSYRQGPRISRHAAQRAQQRGILSRHRDLLFEFGDREEPVGGGLYRLTFSYGRLLLLIQRGVMTRHDCERCARLAVVTDGSAIVTNYRTSRIRGR